MGQQEVYDFLKKNKKKWFNSTEISKNLDVSSGSIANCLKKLKKGDDLSFKETGFRNRYVYQYKK